MHTEIDCLFRKMENDVSYFDFINTGDQINIEKLNQRRQTGDVDHVSRRAHFDNLEMKWVEQDVGNQAKVPGE